MSEASKAAEEITNLIDKNRCATPAVSRETTIDFLETIIEHCECSRDAIREEMESDL